MSIVKSKVIIVIIAFSAISTLKASECPPGMRLAGPGATYCVPGTADEQFAIPSRENQIQSMMSNATQGEMTNPMQGRVNAMATVLEAQAAGDRKIQSMINADPKLRELAKGWWEYFNADKNAEPSYGCAAAFVELRGAVLLSEVGDGYKEAVMTFIGVNIPRPKTPQKIQATLDQNDGQPQTVNVLNYAIPRSTSLGAISFEVPTMQLLLDTMDDKQVFDILIEKKSVINVAWKDGHKARDQMRRCVGQSN